LNKKKKNIDEKRDELNNLLKGFKSALNQPRLYVFKFFDDLKNKIDIQFCKILNETNEAQTNDKIYEQQAKLIEKVQDFESLCSLQINEETLSDFNGTIEKIERDLNEPNVSQDELWNIERFLTNEFKNIHKILFQNKCLFFVNAIQIIEAYDNLIKSRINEESEYLNCLKILSKKIKERNLSGFLVTVDECFIHKELFDIE